MEARRGWEELEKPLPQRGKGNGVLMRPVGQLDSRCLEENLALGLWKLEDSRHSHLLRAGTFGVVPGCLSLQVLASNYSHSHGPLAYKTKSNHVAEESVLRRDWIIMG